MQEEIVQQYRKRLEGKLYDYLSKEKLLGEPFSFSCLGCGGEAHLADDRVWFCPECGRSGGLMELAALRWPHREEWDRIRAVCRVLEIRVKELDAFSSRELADMALQPRDYLVEGLLPSQGLTLLAAPAKTGKSWLVLQLAAALVKGEPFLEQPARKTRVLYLSLEDYPLRLQERSRALDCLGEPDLFFCTRAELLGKGFEEAVEGFLQREQGIGLVIVDTLQKIREAGRDAPSYGMDYQAMDRLKELSDRYRLSVLLVHHTNKKEEAEDSMNRVSGTMGILGGVDGIWLLRRPNRLEGQGLMQVTGRDTDDRLLRLYFDKERCRWEYRGAGEEDELPAQSFADLVEDFLGEDQEWFGTATELLEELKSLGLKRVSQIGSELRKNTAELGRLGICWELRRTDSRRLYHLYRREGQGSALRRLQEPEGEENPFLFPLSDPVKGNELGA